MSLSLVQLLFFGCLNDADNVSYLFTYKVSFWMILFLGKRWQLNATIEEVLIQYKSFHNFALDSAKCNAQ